MNSRFWSIQYFRAIASLAVVTIHLMPRQCANGCDSVLIDTLSRLGVELFFILSGAVMWLTTSGKQVYPNEFMTKRFLRIAPLYYLITILVALAALTMPWLLRTTKFDLQHLIYSLGFLPYRHPTEGQLWPVLIPGWSLNYEMFFYCIFSVCLALPSAFRLLALCGSLALAVLAGQLYAFDSIPLKFYTNPVILDFVLGVILASGYLSNFLASASGAAFKVLAGVLTLLAALHFDLLALSFSLVVSAGIALVVWGVMDMERAGYLPRIVLFKWLGDISYSMYLLQVVTIAATAIAWQAMGLARSGAAQLLFSIAAMAITVGCSAICYRLVEKPSQSLSQVMSRRVRAFEAGEQLTGPA